LSDESTRHELVTRYVASAAAAVSTLAAQAATITAIAGKILDALRAGHFVLTAGNGGSAAEAMHLAEELTGKYRAVRQALPAICLNADATALTCIANDWDFAHVFARQVEAFAHPGDVLVVFSTSGNSANILRALATARQRGVTTIGLLGRGGGQAAAACDLALVVASDQGNHVQEAHQVVLHLILEHLDRHYCHPA
jgi:D-sedoheptulose 7-phosphate isomerase